jgi:hypothetical protein
MNVVSRTYVCRIQYTKDGWRWDASEFRNYGFLCLLLAIAHRGKDDVLRLRLCAGRESTERFWFPSQNSKKMFLVALVDRFPREISFPDAGSRRWRQEMMDAAMTLTTLALLSLYCAPSNTYITAD